MRTPWTGPHAAVPHVDDVEWTEPDQNLRAACHPSTSHRDLIQCGSMGLPWAVVGPPALVVMEPNS
jgi:hypothetical protein